MKKSEVNPVEQEIDEIMAKELYRFAERFLPSTFDANRSEFELPMIDAASRRDAPKIRKQLLGVIDEQIEYRNAGRFYVKPPLFRALRDNRIAREEK